MPDIQIRIRLNIGAVQLNISSPCAYNEKDTSRHADAAIACTTSSFQPHATKALREWYEESLSKRLFAVGPQVPLSAIPSGLYKAPVVAAAGSPFHPIFTFLDAQPVKSVIFISFGSVFYPTQEWQVETMYKTLLETRTPFIASKSSATFKPLSTELDDKIKQSGLGTFVDFVPQREILGHPSMGSFLMHGGNNSLWESILSGVLNIFWSIIGDQVDHSAYMSEVLDCSWELIQVRTGNVDGTPQAVATEFKRVLSELKGEVSERKRKNLQAVRQQTLEALAEDGEVKKEVQALLKWASGDV
ncbi:hypothetical protein FRB94_010223 [Tulasnella sp. JGI-2019a]|nr:hypothetical protein FRB94_010223 [Tulasnella sp. JGI-2019a]